MPSAAMTCPKIMQRSAAVPDCAGAESISGNPGPQKIRTENDANDQNSIDAPPVMILEKEEKRDDRCVSITNRPGGQAAADGTASECVAAAGFETEDSNAASAAGVDTVPEAEWNPLKEVDSALLSALCDPRERKALFRLEQVLLDFMTDTKMTSMEVGGAYNSIVLNQGVSCNSGGTYIRVDEDAQLGLAAVSQQGLQDLQYQQQRGLRQTSFQRLILHRLADRFHIIREQIITNSNVGNNSGEKGLVDVGGNSNAGGGQQQQQTFSPGLIRLVKTDESCVPSHLLIDVDLSLLINYKNPRAKNTSGGNNVVAVGGSYNYADSAGRNLSDSMASATLSETPASVTPTGSVGKKSNRKMVIMKRNSSGSNNLEGKSKGMHKGKSRRKKLEDREKAYEEARARIFGKEKCSDENVERGEGSVPQVSESQEVGTAAIGSCHSSFSVENEAASSASSAHIIPSQLISTTSTERLSPPLPEPQVGEQGHSGPPGIEAEFARQSSLSSASPSFPAAVTGGAVSKAVYRNRQQEENDPDFKRRSDVRPTYVPYMGNPYAPSVMGGNPYATPMGQQLSPPPAALVAAMHAQQQQQQAHQTAHFYHGQLPPPSPHQFPTPQDAGYGAVGNGVPPQWTGLHRGYYPTPPQRGGQDKHLQAWQQAQARLSASQITRSSSGVFSPSTCVGGMNNLQPKQQLKKVLWGDRGELVPGQPGLMTGPVQRVVATAKTEDGEAKRTGHAGVGAVAYKLEDFPALR